MQKPTRVVVVWYENINSLWNNREAVWTAQKTWESVAKAITDEFRKEHNIRTNFRHNVIAPLKKSTTEMIKDRWYEWKEKKLLLNKMSTSQQLAYMAWDAAMTDAWDLGIVYENWRKNIWWQTIEWTNMRSYIWNWMWDYLWTDKWINDGTWVTHILEKYTNLFDANSLTLENKNEIMKTLFDVKNTHNPTTLKKIMISCLDHYIVSKYKMSGGWINSASACSAVSQAIGAAFHDIRDRQIDIGLVIWVSNPLSNAWIWNFDAMKALWSKSVPWAIDRDGFVISVWVNALVLESLESALARWASIYGEIFGYGQALDPSHPTSPNQYGLYTYLAGFNALLDAGLTPEDIMFILLHATSTKKWDIAEARAMKLIFWNNIPHICLPKYGSWHSLWASWGDHFIQLINSAKENFLAPNPHLTKDTLDPHMLDLFGKNIYDKLRIDGSCEFLNVGKWISFSNWFGWRNTALIGWAYIP